MSLRVTRRCPYETDSDMTQKDVKITMNRDVVSRRVVSCRVASTRKVSPGTSASFLPAGKNLAAARNKISKYAIRARACTRNLLLLPALPESRLCHP